MFTPEEWIAVLAALVSTLGFGILFRIKGRKLLFVSVGGMFAWALYLLLFKGLQNDVLCYFIVSMVMSLYAEVMARILKTPSTAFVITTLIPLVPGSSLYYTIEMAVAGDWGSSVSRAGHTVALATALSVGIILVHALSRHAKWPTGHKS